MFVADQTETRLECGPDCKLSQATPALGHTNVDSRLEELIGSMIDGMIEVDGADPELSRKIDLPKSSLRIKVLW